MKLIANFKQLAFFSAIGACALLIAAALSLITGFGQPSTIGALFFVFLGFVSAAKDADEELISALKSTRMEIMCCAALCLALAFYTEVSLQPENISAAELSYKQSQLGSFFLVLAISALGVFTFRSLRYFKKYRTLRATPFAK